MLDWAGESQYDVEPKRLARLGYLEARKEPGRTRERTVYTLTEKGRDALREVAGHRHPQPLKRESLLRLMITDLVGEDAARDEPPHAPRGYRRFRPGWTRAPRAASRSRIGASTWGW